MAPPIQLPETGFLRLAQIISDKKADPPIPAVIPVSKSKWWEGVKNGDYPKSFKLGPKTTTWKVTDIRALSEKWMRVLALFIDGQKRTRFDVEKFGDHVLNTSVSQIGKRGICFPRKPVTIEGRFGTIHCKRYWLEPEEIAKALRLLGVRP